MVDIQKNPPEFYQARDDVDGGMLSKRSMRTLRKHCAALRMRQPWEDDPKCTGAIMRKAEWLAKVDGEIGRRKDARRSRIISISEKVAAGLIVALLVWLSSRIYSSWKSSPPVVPQTVPSQPQPSSNSSSAPVVTGNQLTKKASGTPVGPAPGAPRTAPQR